MPTIYSFDPSGSNVANLITDELHSITPGTNQVIVLSAGAFYTDSVVIKQGLTTLTNSPVIQYQFRALDPELIAMTGQEVACGIYFTNVISGDVEVTYQAVGGKQGQNTGMIADLTTLLTILANGDPMDWNNINNKPSTVYVDPHEHDLEDMTDIAILSDKLEDWTNALINKRSLLQSNQYLAERVERMLYIIAGLRNDLNQVAGIGGLFEVISNKSQDIEAEPSPNKYPSTQAVIDYVDTLLTEGWEDAIDYAADIVFTASDTKKTIGYPDVATGFVYSVPVANLPLITTGSWKGGDLADIEFYSSNNPLAVIGNDGFNFTTDPTLATMVEVATWNGTDTSLIAPEVSIVPSTDTISLSNFETATTANLPTNASLGAEPITGWSYNGTGCYITDSWGINGGRSLAFNGANGVGYVSATLPNLLPAHIESISGIGANRSWSMNLTARVSFDRKPDSIIPINFYSASTDEMVQVEIVLISPQALVTTTVVSAGGVVSTDIQWIDYDVLTIDKIEEWTFPLNHHLYGFKFDLGLVYEHDNSVPANRKWRTFITTYPRTTYSNCTMVGEITAGPLTTTDLICRLGYKFGPTYSFDLPLDPRMAAMNAIDDFRISTRALLLEPTPGVFKFDYSSFMDNGVVTSVVPAGVSGSWTTPFPIVRFNMANSVEGFFINGATMECGFRRKPYIDPVTTLEVPGIEVFIRCIGNISGVNKMSIEVFKRTGITETSPAGTETSLSALNNQAANLFWVRSAGLYFDTRTASNYNAKLRLATQIIATDVVSSITSSNDILLTDLAGINEFFIRTDHPGITVDLYTDTNTNFTTDEFKPYQVSSVYHIFKNAQYALGPDEPRFKYIGVSDYELKVNTEGTNLQGNNGRDVFLNIDGRLSELEHLPIPYIPGIVIDNTNAKYKVEREQIRYTPRPSALPFTISGDWYGLTPRPILFSEASGAGTTIQDSGYTVQFTGNIVEESLALTPPNTTTYSKLLAAPRILPDDDFDVTPLVFKFARADVGYSSTHMFFGLCSSIDPSTKFEIDLVYNAVDNLLDHEYNVVTGSSTTDMINIRYFDNGTITYMFDSTGHLTDPAIPGLTWETTTECYMSYSAYPNPAIEHGYFAAAAIQMFLIDMGVPGKVDLVFNQYISTSAEEFLRIQDLPQTLFQDVDRFFVRVPNITDYPNFEQGGKDEFYLSLFDGTKVGINTLSGYVPIAYPVTPLIITPTNLASPSITIDYITTPLLMSGFGDKDLFLERYSTSGNDVDAINVDFENSGTDLISINAQTAIVEVNTKVNNVKAMLNRFSSVRQTVLSGPRTLSGVANLLTRTDDYEWGIQATLTEPAILSFGDGFDEYGEKNYIIKLTEDIVTTGVEGNIYYYAEYDLVTEILSIKTTSQKPVYTIKKPTGVLTGTIWYPTDHRERARYYNGSIWSTDDNNKLYLMLGTSRDDVMYTYAYQGKDLLTGSRINAKFYNATSGAPTTPIDPVTNLLYTPDDWASNISSIVDIVDNLGVGSMNKDIRFELKVTHAKANTGTNDISLSDSSMSTLDWSAIDDGGDVIDLSSCFNWTGADDYGAIFTITKRDGTFRMTYMDGSSGTSNMAFSKVPGLTSPRAMKGKLSAYVYRTF